MYPIFIILENYDVQKNIYSQKQFFYSHFLNTFAKLYFKIYKFIFMIIYIYIVT